MQRQTRRSHGGSHPARPAGPAKLSPATLPVSTPSSTTSTSPGEATLGFLPADVDVRDEGELADQRSAEKDEAERDFVEVPEFAAARGEGKHSHRGDVHAYVDDFYSALPAFSSEFPDSHIM